MIGNIGQLENIIYSDSILSAVYTADRIFYAIFDSHHRLINTSLESIDKADLSSLLSMGFKKKIVAVDSFSIHLPEGIDGAPFLKDCAFVLPHCNTHSDLLLGIKAVTHYTLDRNTENVLSSFFKDDEIMHLSTVIASYLYPAVKDKALLLGGDGFLYISVMGPEGLKMINRYKCDQPEDYLYYAQLCFSGLNLDRDNTSLEIAGKIDAESKIYDLLDPYFGEIHFSDPVLFHLPDNQSIDKHIFMDHYMSYLCVL